MKKLFIPAVALSLLILSACSEDQSAGNVIDPNAIANNSSSSTENPVVSSTSTLDGFVVNFDEIYKFTTEPTARKQYETYTVDTYGAENAASASCATKSGQELTGVIKIKDNFIIRAYSGRNLKAGIDPLVYMFQKTCVHFYNDLDFTIDTLRVNGNNFDYVCITESEYMDIDETIFMFDAIMPSNCKELEIQDIYDSLAALKPTIITFPEENLDTITIDTTSRTLENYAFQYARPEDLSFDKHVLIYSSNIEFNKKCFEAMGRYKELSNGNIIFDSERIMSIEKEAFPACFPETDSVVGFSKINTSCKYYLVQADDANQPTGHVLTKVSKDTIEVTNIHPSGVCIATNMFNAVHFLIEDCEGIFNENAAIKYNGAYSNRWSCDEEYNEPPINIKSYGEWYSESLLEN
ncbi:MAG: hypothetical protein MJZ05_02835 [Fibrobacter sp.]|nr:hypothetical protein [Fibrobacter sp.]